MFPRLLRTALTLVCTAFLASGSGAAAKRPNILWITCEDTSPDLGCYGAAGAQTPHLDALAGEGMRFTRAFSTSPICAPSRSTLITGMYASTIGTHHMRSKAIPPAGIRCFTEYLREAGYYCTNNAKTDYNFDPPLAAWDENGRQAHWRNRPAGAPFFSVFNLTVSHEGKTHMNNRRFNREAGADLPPDKRHDPALVQLPPYYPDTPEIRRTWARYQDMVSAMDTQAGRILDQLREDNLAEETVVFFFSDHGRGMPRAKRSLYDAGTHVPMIVRIPGGKGRQVREDLVSLIDVAPTVLSLAGLTPPSAMPGRVFLGAGVAPPPDKVFFTRDRVDEKHDMVRSVRDGRFRYVRNFLPDRPSTQRTAYELRSPILRELIRLHDDGQLSGPQTLYMQPRRPAEELYDTVADPHEIRNLTGSPEHRERLAAMREALDNWMKRTGDLGLVPEAKLQEQWFPGGKKPVTEAPVLTPAGGQRETTVSVRMQCPTPGASIVWKIDGPDAHWHLYHGPVEISPASGAAGTSVTLRARASRAGYQDSPPATAGF